MRLMGFIKWWWNKTEWMYRIPIIVVIYCIIASLSAFYFGPISLLFIPFSLLLFMCIFATGMFMSSAVNSTKTNWKTYSNIHEDDAQKIINKLKGVDPNRTTSTGPNL